MKKWKKALDKVTKKLDTNVSRLVGMPEGVKIGHAMDPDSEKHKAAVVSLRENIFGDTKISADEVDAPVSAPSDLPSDVQERAKRFDSIEAMEAWLTLAESASHENINDVLASLSGDSSKHDLIQTIIDVANRKSGYIPSEDVVAAAYCNVEMIKYFHTDLNIIEGFYKAAETACSGANESGSLDVLKYLVSNHLLNDAEVNKCINYLNEYMSSIASHGEEIPHQMLAILTLAHDDQDWVVDLSGESLNGETLA